jgi:hypothetical protein
MSTLYMMVGRIVSVIMNNHMIDNCYCFQLHDSDMISFYFSLFGSIWILCSIERLVSEHLSI